MEVWSSLSSGPRASLPAAVLAWLAARLVHPGAIPSARYRRHRPLSLESAWTRSPRCCWMGCRTGAPAVWSASPRPRWRQPGLAAWRACRGGFCQPDGTFITTLDDPAPLAWELAAAGEAVCVDGLATRAQRPAAGPTRRCCTTPNATSTPPKAWRSPPSGATRCGWWTAAGRAAATSTNSLNWADWAGAGRGRGGQPAGPWFRGLAKTHQHWHSPVGDRAAPSAGSATPSGPTTACRQAGARWWSSQSPIWPTPGVAPLAWAAVPRPGRLPGRRRTQLP
jgi:hypothetical protein